MADTAAPAPPLDIRSTFGAIFVGTVLGSLFYGITLFQTLIYFAKYPRDTLWIKGLVVGLWIIDTITFILEVEGTWFYLVLSYDFPENLGKQVFSIRLETIFTYSVSFVVHIFLVHRIHILTGKKQWLTWSLVILSVASWALGLTISGLLMSAPNFADNHRPAMSDTVAAHKVVTMAVDIILAVLLCWLLHQGRSGIKRTDSLINKLMFLAFNRGVAVAIVQAMYLITYFGWPNATYWIIPHYISSKLYVNTTLATLNIRETLQQSLDTDEAITISKMRFNKLMVRGPHNVTDDSDATAVSLPTLKPRTTAATKSSGTDRTQTSSGDKSMSFAQKSALDSRINTNHSNVSLDDHEDKHTTSRRTGSLDV